MDKDPSAKEIMDWVKEGQKRKIHIMPLNDKEDSLLINFVDLNPITQVYLAVDVLKGSKTL
jgi:disulfide oxidoreductase YuzD